MYGIGKTWADALRKFSGGRMASTKDNTESNELYNGKDFPAVNDIRLPMANPPPPRDHYLKNVNRFFRKFDNKHYVLIFQIQSLILASRHMRHRII